MSVCTATRRLPAVLHTPRRHLATTASVSPNPNRKPPPPPPRKPKEYKALFRGFAHLKPQTDLTARPTPALALHTCTPPRQLFAELLRTPVPEDADAEAQAGPLTAALRSFSRLEDYPAALVVLRVLADRALPVTERTYAAATAGIAHRLAAERALPRRPHLFARAMLGDPVPAGLSAAKEARWVRRKLLTHNMPPRALKPREVREGELDIVPLIFVLRRAFVVHGSLTKTKDNVPWSDDARRRAEAKARREMSPNDVS